MCGRELNGTSLEVPAYMSHFCYSMKLCQHLCHKRVNVSQGCTHKQQSSYQTYTGYSGAQEKLWWHKSQVCLCIMSLCIDCCFQFNCITFKTKVRLQLIKLFPIQLILLRMVSVLQAYPQLMAEKFAGSWFNITQQSEPITTFR